ncbi:increased loss of mitochondrial dna 1 [Trichoderma arundinaceum]|uniref:Increased loss of mitochondrial dna 1 n=1 Tax=Trichoderma arundinaceum TaxID=490622 RepID=A0A395NKB6_TRIAR|nr:increased loss of mitochondrial dna 1 [Trichoderma arundinaceum]
MALISSTTLISSISLFHLTLAYFFLFRPKTIEDQALVWVLGESMNLPEVRGFDVPNAALALLAVILAFSGISDLVSLTMPEEFSTLYYWGTQAPLRFFLSMLLVFYSYTFGPNSPLFSSSSSSSSSTRRPHSHKAPASGSDHLHNRLLFSFMFVEMMVWFWTWITLRDERSSIVEKMRKQHEREAHSH